MTSVDRSRARAPPTPLELDAGPPSAKSRFDLGSPTSPSGHACEPQSPGDADLAWLAAPLAPAPAPAELGDEELAPLPPPFVSTLSALAAAHPGAVSWVSPGESFTLSPNAAELEAALPRFFPEPLPPSASHVPRFLARARNNGFVRLGFVRLGRRLYKREARPAPPPRKRLLIRAPPQVRAPKRVRFAPVEAVVVGVADAEPDRRAVPCARLSVGEYLEVRSMSRVPVENLSAAQGVTPCPSKWRLGRSDHLRLAPGGWADCFLGMDSLS